MRRLASRWAAVAGGLALAGGGQAHAAGYALKEQSTTAQGNAFAGATAGADDVSYMFFNPAALGWVDKVEVAAVTTLVAPKSEMKNASGSTAFGTPISGSTSDDDFGENAVVPAFYAAVPLPAGLRAGLGVNVPYGLETSYSRDWVGRYHGVKSELHDPEHQPGPGLAAGRVAQRRRGLPGAVCRRHPDQRRRFRHHRRRQRRARLGAGQPGRLCPAARRRLGLWLERRGDRPAAGRHAPGRGLSLGGRPYAARRRELHRRR